MDETNKLSGVVCLVGGVGGRSRWSRSDGTIGNASAIGYLGVASSANKTLGRRVGVTQKTNSLTGRTGNALTLLSIIPKLTNKTSETK